jgi:hypothetical protein
MFPNEPEEMFIDGFEGLRIILDGKNVEGEILTYEKPREQVFKDIIFSLDGKKYKFVVEEVE